MKTNNLILIGESISILATVLIAMKIMILKPNCFSALDGYTTILPIILTKIVELKLLFRK